MKDFCFSKNSIKKMGEGVTIDQKKIFAINISKVFRIYKGRYKGRNTDVNSTQTVLKIEEGTLPNSSYKDSMAQLPKLKQAFFFSRKENYKLVMLRSLDTKIPKISEQIKKSVKASRQ